MAKVLFKVSWFAPGGRRFRKSVNNADLKDVPEHLLKFLPKTAVIVDGPVPAAAEDEETLRDHDTERASGDAAEKANQDADERAAFRRAMENRRKRRG